MSNANPTRQALEANDPWLKNANVDASSFPADPPSDDADGFLPDPRFGQLDSRGLGPDGGLKKFLSNPDEEAVALLERTDPALAERLRNADPGREHTFLIDNEECIVFRQDGEWCVKLPSGQMVRFPNAVNRDAAQVACARFLQNKRPPSLSEQERLEIARLAGSGTPDGRNEALGMGLARLYPEISELITPDEVRYFVSDPAKLEILNGLVYTVWETSVPYRVSEEFRAYLSAWANSRPVTFAMCDSAWLAFTEGRQANPEPQPQAPTPPDLNAMSDEEVSELYGNVALEHARARR